MKMKNLALFWLIMACVGMNISAGESLFPALKGMTNPESPAEYTAENLFEYINGAADVFIGYDFQHLYSMSYSGPEGRSITADVYVHADKANGFGIYGQEKPLQGDFLSIGTEGYYETGVLNFFQGRYYVKISAFDLGDQDRELLSDLARGIAKSIPDPPGFPPVLKAFPEENRIPRSERFTRRNFLGHAFLENAYTCDYTIQDTKVQPFILAAASPKAAEAMVQAYLAFARSRNSDVKKSAESARFTDPYYRSRGMLTLNWRGRYVWGLFCTDIAIADRMTKAISDALSKSDGPA